MYKSSLFFEYWVQVKLLSIIYNICIWKNKLFFYKNRKSSEEEKMLEDLPYLNKLFFNENFIFCMKLFSKCGSHY